MTDKQIMTFEEGAAFEPPTPSLNGHVDESEPKTAYTVDTKAGTFTTSKGEVLAARMDVDVSATLLDRMRLQGKPEVPMVEVTVIGGRKQWQSNPQDPNYLAAVELFNNESNERIARYVLLHLLKSRPVPEEWLAVHREYFPGASEAELKFNWLSSRIGDTAEEWSAVTAFALGRAIPTQEGLNEAAASFRRDS